MSEKKNLMDDFEDLEAKEAKERMKNRVRKENKQMKKKVARSKRLRMQIIRICAALAVLFGIREFISYSNIGVIAKWRAIYIETAMTTHSHQWLATMLFPKRVIDQVMADLDNQMAAQEGIDGNGDGVNIQDVEVDSKNFYEVYTELDTDEFKEYISKHQDLVKNGYDGLIIEDLDNDLGLKTVQGDDLLVVNVPYNLVIVGVSGSGYVGKLAIVKDPSQVSQVKSKYLGSNGQEISTLAENNDAILAINAAAFVDVEGHGSGGTPNGKLVVDGKDYGTVNEQWKFYGMKYDNLLYITSVGKVKDSEYRWGVQFYPAMIVDGENVLTASSGGTGIQPRTVIAQADDGAFMMLIVDGRQVGYSLGTTVSECADIVSRYGAVQAGNLDGGSSAVMWYNGELITKSSSATGRGRYSPSALVVTAPENK